MLPIIRCRTGDRSTTGFSICFRKATYHVITYPPYIFPLTPTAEIVIKQQLLFFFPVRAHHIFLHNIRNKKLRQASRIQELLAALFYILHDICHDSAHAPTFDLLKIRTPEPFIEISVLMSNTPPLRLEIVIAYSSIIPGIVPSGI